MVWGCHAVKDDVDVDEISEFEIRDTLKSLDVWNIAALYCKIPIKSMLDRLRSLLTIKFLYKLGN